MAKQLIVDKSVFHSLYQCDEILREFVREYNIVFPYSLAIECLISESQAQDKDPVKLLEGFDKAIKAGAKMGYSSFKLFQTEKRTLCPAKSVVDEASTQQVRSNNLNADISFVRQEAESCKEVFSPKICMLLQIAEELYKNLCNQEKLSQAFRQETQRNARYKKWITVTDGLMEDIMKRLFSEEISCCADHTWFTWQMARLWFAYCYEWAFRKNITGLSETRNISNDFYDIEYVTYLSRADGLLTNDKKLQFPLARAAFSSSEVFSVDTSKTPEEILSEIAMIIPQNYKIE